MIEIIHYFKFLSEKLNLTGVSETLMNIVSVCINIAVFVLIVYNVVKLIYKFLRNRKAAKDLHPFFSVLDVKKHTKYYIQTKCQNISPTQEHEPKSTHALVTKEKLVRFFLKTAFDERKEDKRFYLVLADSGMGKTTFMINLYLRYNSVFNISKKYKIKLLSFNNQHFTEKLIELKPESSQTILLLDAFDEDIKAIPNYETRLDDIIDLVQDFRIVVITCRIQFFPSEQAEPHELKITRSTEGGAFYRLNKIYISPFDDKDISNYLNKKYGILQFWNRKTKMLAWQIVKKSPHLMVRPMLLAFVEDLVQEHKTYEFRYQIYETMVEKWIEREAKRKPIDKKEKFAHDLKIFSQKIANEFFQKQNEIYSLQLNSNEILEFSKNYNIDLDDLEKTGRSLLTRNAGGYWKFAHKSILEYFIAKDEIEKTNYNPNPTFPGMNLARDFYNEMILCNYTYPVLLKGIIDGSYFTEKNRQLRGLEELKKHEMEDIVYLTIHSKSPPCFDVKGFPTLVLHRALHPLKKLNIFIDPRDGNMYNTLQIGNQVWMIDNLKYLPKMKCPELYNYESFDSNFESVYVKHKVIDLNLITITGESEQERWDIIIRRFGRTYTLNDIFMAPPSGWHVPNENEWITLFKYIQKKFNSYDTSTEIIYDDLLYYPKSLIERISNTVCCLYIALQQINKPGFRVSLGGYYSSEGLIGIGDNTRFWTSTARNGVHLLIHVSEFEKINYSHNYNIKDGYYIRCIKDSEKDINPSGIYRETLEKIIDEVRQRSRKNSKID
jgi:uncharacterized protein (TIGR02145 family)